METYLFEWAHLLVRWFHIIAGIAWIGASFYFVMLDMSLKPPEKEEDKKRGVHGELWAVHGGGFYNSQKFLIGPKGEPLSNNLHWSKWEAYTTWISGMLMLAIVYWAGASSHLIDPSVLVITPVQAISISIGVIVVGWVVYDVLCRALTGRENILALCLLVFVIFATWGLHQFFAGRGAYIHVGAMLGTWMMANVFFHIIPGQKKMVAQIRAGEEVDPRPGVIGKQRSVHNTYFTLPVLFTMISSHYPMTFGHANGWMVLVVLMFAGVLVRQFFVMRHQGQVKLWLPITAGALILALMVLMRPTPVDASGDPVEFVEIQQIVEARCSSCHSSSPTQPGFMEAPLGVVMETPSQIKNNSRAALESVSTNYMPLANITGMTDEERLIFQIWVAQGANIE